MCVCVCVRVSCELLRVATQKLKFIRAYIFHHHHQHRHWRHHHPAPHQVVVIIVAQLDVWVFSKLLLPRNSSSITN